MEENIKIGIVALACAVIFSACSNDDALNTKTEKMKSDEVVIKDGHYQKMSALDENGYSDIVTFNITNGDITDFEFNGYQMLKESSLSKKEMSVQGQYNLVDNTGAPWHEQVAEVEKFVNENDGFKDIEFNEEGKSSTINGVTIPYKNAKELFDEALNNGPVTMGNFEDGYYFGTDTPTYAIPQVAYVVEYGNIVGIHFDELFIDESYIKDESRMYKSLAAAAGEFNIPSGSIGTYNEQINSVDAFVLENQGFDVEVNGAGKTDAISGATINVGVYQRAFENATKK